jgi:hypothetical protein
MTKIMTGIMSTIVTTLFIFAVSCGKTDVNNNPETPHAGKKLFESDFSDSRFQLGQIDISADSKGAWQNWKAWNTTTGKLESVLPYDADYSIFQYICNTTVTPVTISDHIVNEVHRVKGPLGDSIYALCQTVKQNILADGTATQDVLLINRENPETEAKEMYYTYWCIFQSDLAEKLGTNQGYDNWRMMSEWKTGGSTDYRAATIIEKDISTGNLYWITTGEGWDTQGQHHDYWTVKNNMVPVPAGEWFKYEVYWNRSSGSKGRYWAAVNGQIIVDRKGSLYPENTAYPEKIDRIFLNNIYSGGMAPMFQWTANLEIWDGWPNGEGVSLYSLSPSIFHSF